MEITNIDQGLLITNGGYSIVLILVKILIIFVSSIFLLMGLTKAKTAEHKEDPSMNHPFMMFTGGLFWICVGIYTPLESKRSQILFDSKLKQVYVTSKDYKFSIPYQDFSFISAVSDQFIDEEESNSGSEIVHLSFFTKYGLELELGSINKNISSKELTKILNQISLPVFTSIKDISENVYSKPETDFNFELTLGNKKENPSWDWQDSPNVSSIFIYISLFIYGLCLVYFFLRILPGGRRPSLKHWCFGISFLSFSGFVLYLGLLYGFGRNQINWQGDIAERRFSVFGFTLSEQKLKRPTLASALLVEPIENQGECLIYIFSKSDRYPSIFERIYTTKKEGIYRFDESNLFFKINVCSLSLENRIELLKNFYNFKYMR